MSASNRFAPLSPQAFADDQRRRAEAEAEIARKEAELAAATDRLDRARTTEGELQAELDTARREAGEGPPQVQ